MTDSPQSEDSLSSAGIVFGVMLLVVGGTMYLIAPASVLPVVREELSIGPAAAGWIVSVMFGTQVLVSIPAGIGIDRLNNRRVVVAVALGFVVTSVWSWFAAGNADYWSFMASRGFAGALLAVGWNASVNVTRRSVNERHRATVLGVFTASAPIGFALSHLYAPVTVERLGWNSIFLVPAVLAAIGASVFVVASHRRDLTGGDSQSAGVSDFGRVLSNRRLWNVALLAFLAYSVYVFVNSWVPSFLTEEVGLSLGESGFLVALFPAIGIISRSGGGVVADRLFGSRNRPVILASFVVTAPAVVAIMVVSRLILVFLALAITGLFVQLGIGLFYAYIDQIVEPNVAGTAIAVLSTLGFLGSFSAPVVAGMLIEWSESYTPAFAYATTAALLGVGLAWRLEEDPPT